MKTENTLTRVSGFGFPKRFDYIIGTLTNGDDLIIIDDANGIHFGILPGRILKRNIFELGEEVYFTNKYGCKTHEWKFFNDEVENLINDIKNSPAIGGADEIFGAGYLFLGTFSSDVYADDAYEKILSYVNSEK